MDDNVFNMMAIQGILLQFKLYSDKAQDGDTALMMVKKRYEKYGDSYKLIIIDYQMPGQNGI